MTWEGVEGCAGSRRRKTSAEEERDHAENATFTYWSVSVVCISEKEGRG